MLLVGIYLILTGDENRNLQPIVDILDGGDKLVHNVAVGSMCRSHDSKSMLFYLQKPPRSSSSLHV